MCQIGHMKPEQLLGVAGNSSRRWQGALDMTMFWTVAKLWDERVSLRCCIHFPNRWEL